MNSRPLFLLKKYSTYRPKTPDTNHIPSKTKIVFILIFGHHSTNCSHSNLQSPSATYLHLSLSSIALFHIGLLVCDSVFKGIDFICVHACVFMCVYAHACDYVCLLVQACASVCREARNQCQVLFSITSIFFVETGYFNVP